MICSFDRLRMVRRVRGFLKLIRESIERQLPVVPIASGWSAWRVPDRRARQHDALRGGTAKLPNVMIGNHRQPMTFVREWSRA
jgi:hypothetical protein